MHLTSVDTEPIAIRSALQAILQRIGLVTPYDLQHILEQNDIEIDGKEKRKQLELLSDETNSKLVYGNIEWDSILYPYVLTHQAFEQINTAIWKHIDILKVGFGLSRKEMCSIIIGIIILSFKKRVEMSNEHQE